MTLIQRYTPQLCVECTLCTTHHHQPISLWLSYADIIACGTENLSDYIHSEHGIVARGHTRVTVSDEEYSLNQCGDTLPLIDAALDTLSALHDPVLDYHPLRAWKHASPYYTSTASFMPDLDEFYRSYLGSVDSTHDMVTQFSTATGTQVTVAQIMEHYTVITDRDEHPRVLSVHEVEHSTEPMLLYRN